MPDLPHLPLRRVEYEAARKKKPGFGKLPPRDYGQHGATIQRQLDDTLGGFVRQPPPRGIDPTLILRVKLSGNVDEETWQRAGLALVGRTEERTLVLFSSDAELRQFRQQVEAYRGGPPPTQKGAPYAGLVSNIEVVDRMEPADRIGRLLRAEGVTSPDHFADRTQYTLDVELWHTGSTPDCQTRLAQIRTFVETQGGRITDTYAGSSLVLARVKAGGQCIKTLLSLDAVATIDLPPRVSLRVFEHLNVSLQDLGRTPPPPGDAPGVCAIDSGVTSAHPLLGPAVGEATAVPAQLGDPSDPHGHGTLVAGLALYGDVAQCIEQRRFVPQLRLFSARVLNANNEFDDESLITTQMVQAIEYFKNTYGCRVFNASLGDPRTPFNGGKLSPWAAILDHLARELDIVIVVSAGNYEHEPPGANDPDHHVSGYPRYLLDPPAKIIEPATGCIVLTVGALANSAQVPPGAAGVGFRPIAQPGEPSPFTRSGPGIGGAIKPELCADGGNRGYNGTTRRLQDLTELAIISTNREYLTRLFAVDSGTSFAAPRVAHAAARLFGRFPRASANLIRALLASSATVPEPASTLLEPIGDDAVRQVCGYGVPSQERAGSSESNRVVLYAENALPFDRFHIYEVPVPDEFYGDYDGDRRISVCLAFDPPVRHSRLDYLGTTMSFRLIRGKNPTDVAEAFRSRTKEEPKVERIGSPFDCPMSPKPTVREGSTLQKATFTMRRKPDAYGDTYYLVVRCQREWALDQHFPQRYAVVVSIEQDARVDIYARLQARLRVPVRVQIRP